MHNHRKDVSPYAYEVMLEIEKGLNHPKLGHQINHAQIINWFSGPSGTNYLT